MVGRDTQAPQPLPLLDSRRQAARMKYEPDPDFGIPIGLPPEMMPDIPRIRTAKEDGEAIYFAMAKAGKRERRR